MVTACRGARTQTCSFLQCAERNPWLILVVAESSVSEMKECDLHFPLWQAAMPRQEFDQPVSSLRNLPQVEAVFLGRG